MSRPEEEKDERRTAVSGAGRSAEKTRRISRRSRDTWESERTCWSHCCRRRVKRGREGSGRRRCERKRFVRELNKKGQRVLQRKATILRVMQQGLTENSTKGARRELQEKADGWEKSSYLSPSRLPAAATLPDPVSAAAPPPSPPLQLPHHPYSSASSFFSSSRHYPPLSRLLLPPLPPLPQSQSFP